ncbi:MAG TPA: endonuclease/exonuclease/phosphatase family protein [Hyphomicrobiaceae bacterium]|nr:endonuclease/exonuclease/phosphatase family protein [Hyphomicrobiaceae bacterium]
MRLATFNIENLDIGPDAAVRLETRTATLRPILERLAADVLCLQEVNGQHVPGAPERRLVALDALLQGTRYAAYHRVATTGPSGVGAASVHNLVTLSRFPIRAHREVRHDLMRPPLHNSLSDAAKDAPPQPVTFDRPLLLAVIDVPGPRLLHVINLHLRAARASPIAGGKLDGTTWRTTGGWAEGYFLSSLKRTAQALELRLLVDQLLADDPGALIAVAGDFNAEDHETPVRLAVAEQDQTGNAALAALALAVLDRAVPDDRRWSVLHRGRAQMLDHILASAELARRFVRLEVHNDGLTDEAIDDAACVVGSSHAPLVAEFTTNSQGG